MKELPPDIFKAMRSGDVEYLKHAGRQGGLATAKKRDIEQAKDDLAREIRELEEWRRRVSTNEHIIDFEGNDQDYIDDKD